MRKPASSSAKAGFSLAEVTLALGIAAFCLIAVFGLLPVGMTSNQISTEQTTAASLVTAVAADLRATLLTSGTSSIYKIEIPASGGTANSPQHLYFDVGGAPDKSATLSNPAPYNATSSIFRVSVAFYPPASAAKNATQVRFLVTWTAPVNGAVTAGNWPTRYSGSFETITALNRN